MHRPAYLLSAFKGLVDASGSHIPHLRVHIHIRQLRTKTSFQTDNIGKLQSCQAVSGIAGQDVLPANAPSHRKITNDARKKTEDIPSSVLVQNRSEEDKININELIKEGHPERILLGLLSSSGTEFIRNADDETFAAALDGVKPDKLFDEFKDVYHYLTPSLEAAPIYRWTRSLESRFEKFTAQLDSIIETRRSRGRPLNLSTYRFLLDCARVMGDGKLAEQVFHVMMREDGVNPDLECTNSMMEAACWNGAFNSLTRWRFRVTDTYLKIRSSTNPSPDLENIRVARRLSDRKESIRHKTLDHFKELVASGLTGNESTFTNLMVAMGREGDIEGVKSILKSVWNIDLDLLCTFDEEELQSPTFYEDSSPLRPSSRLLLTVVHVFGSNNHVSTAFTLADYISRNYNLEIPSSVWLALCEWTHVLSTFRSQQQIRRGQKVGETSAAVFDQLWLAMTDKPHNIRPDATMLMLRTKSLLGTFQFEKSLDCLRTAKKLIQDQRKELDNLKNTILDHVAQLGTELSQILLSPMEVQLDNGLLSASTLDMRRKFTIASLRLDRDLQLLIVAVRRLFKTFHIAGSNWSGRLPDIVSEFSEYLPDQISYWTTNGKVVIEGKETREMAIRENNGAQHTVFGIMRSLLDRDNHEDIVRGIQLLPGYISKQCQPCLTCGSLSHSSAECLLKTEASPRSENSDQLPVVSRMILTDKRLTRIRKEQTLRPLPVYEKLQLAKS